ncbi:MAG TPA: hypothetical protein VHE82_13055 [Gemmatimonadaceae bacterium]|jgi:hypothetical protein|nr:hypothetical protein [Gemmatimonadaceae bacterium]
MKRTLLHSFALAAVLTVAASSSALAGPPWIAIEYPANPFDASSRGAFLTVRTYHHGEFQSTTVTGTAEGVVDGKRQSMRLDIRPGSQPGMYVVRWQRPATGRWVLVINSGTAGVSEATAVVEISPSGGVAGVTVPTRSIGNGWISPRAVATSEIDALLQGRALASVGVAAQTARTR